MTAPEPVRVPFVVVDVETTGLDYERDFAIEVAWWSLTTGERGEFVPPHSVRDVLTIASVEALRINRYIDRLATAEQDRDGRELIRLYEQFAGPLIRTAGEWMEESDAPAPRAILAGCQPHFDAHMTSKLFMANEAVEDEPTPWFHRVRDLGSYAAGVLGLPLDHKPLSGADVCDRLGIPRGDHTAAGDVTAEGECFLALAQIAATTDPSARRAGTVTTLEINHA